MDPWNSNPLESQLSLSWLSPGVRIMKRFPGDSDVRPGLRTVWLQSGHTCERQDTWVDLGFLCHGRVVTGVLLLLLLLLLDAAYSHCCAVIWSCLTLCDPKDCSTPDFPVLHHLLEFGSNSCPLSRWCHRTISSGMFIHIPDLILSALHMLTHLMLKTSLWGRYHYQWKKWKC